MAQQGLASLKGRWGQVLDLEEALALIDQAVQTTRQTDGLLHELGGLRPLQCCVGSLHQLRTLSDAQGEEQTMPLPWTLSI
jgi:hypothetical protein